MKNKGWQTHLFICTGPSLAPAPSSVHTDPTRSHVAAGANAHAQPILASSPCLPHRSLQRVAHQVAGYASLASVIACLMTGDSNHGRKPVRTVDKRD